MPIPKPRSNENRGKFIDRCMGSSTMNEEYPKSNQRAAICSTAWKERSTSTRGNDMTILTEEIFAVGIWNGIDFEVEDLNLIAAAFHALGDNHQVPLKMGHNEEQPFTDGQPALGWVTDVFVQDSKLMAKFEDVPDIVAEAISKKLYKNKSIELDMGVEYKGEYYFWVLSGVALLGADIPAVNTLNDLGALMSRDTDALHFKKRVAFTATNEKSNRSTNMSDKDKDPTLQEQFNTLTAQFTALKGEHEKLVNTNLSLEQDAIKMKATNRVAEETEKHRIQLEERKVLEADLEGMVKSKQIAPFTRDDILRDYDEATDKSVVMFSVKTLKKTIEGNPTYFGAEQARNEANQQRQESDKDASEIVRDRTREFMSKHGEKNFNAAKRAVLQADTELANRYTKGV